MRAMPHDLPPDFKDRPKLERLWIDFQVLIRRRAVKTVCCESFRTKGRACKGCATLYDPESSNAYDAFLGKIAKRRESPPPNATPSP